MIGRVAPLGFVIFVAGGLISGAVGLRNVAAVGGSHTTTATDTYQADPGVSASSISVPPQPSLLMPQPVAPPIVATSVPSTDQAPAVVTTRAEPTWRLAYVVDGNLWETNGSAPQELTQDGSMWQPALGDSGFAFVQRTRNASDVWLASSSSAPRAVTSDASPVAAQSHWASQPAFLPGKDRLYVLADFNKSNTGVGDLAVWELSAHGDILAQITHPPAYAGGDQDVTVNPTNPQQIIFTRYSYSGTQLVEQLQWLDVANPITIPLTEPEHASRQASFSPDGTRLAFVQSGAGQEQELYVATLDVTATPPKLVNMQEVARGMIANPSWSPDGTGLAYVALTGDQFQVWALDMQTDADATLSISQPRQITSGPSVDASSRPLYLSLDQADQLRQWLAPTF